MILYTILYILAVLFLFSGTLFFFGFAKMIRSYRKRYDNVYADIDEKKGGTSK